NPIGLAAGFDKNAELIEIMPAVGFGFTEVGSVTGRACAGNPKPRLWRLPKSRSLIVYYGLKNDGAEEIAKRLKANEVGSGYTRSNLVRPKFPVGVSIAKTNDDKTITTEDGVADYLFAYQTFIEAGIGDYYTINISCPNAHGGQPFTDLTRLDLLLKTLNFGHGTPPKSDLVPTSQSFEGRSTRDTTSSALPWPKPIFLKMPPDLLPTQIDGIINLAKIYKIDGFICSNLTKDRENDAVKNKIKDDLPTDNGGLSGKVAEDLANEQIKYIYEKINPPRGLPSGKSKKMIIIGCGGVFSAEDAYIKIKAGASLIQLITGMIFEGPQLISQINQELVELLQKDGYKNIGEAIGKGF
ncbi:MAG: quinone-dependent dihydroorotate dehydrogenase, partial [Candidatus Vogelbacteria bacterium]|nr:quinone-dependent dihydroorotate dehydrogenase [Candidatus Vogelbacteria bacterium]